MSGRNPGLYWRLCWGIITPAVMITILLYTFVTYKPLTYRGYIYPDTAYGTTTIRLEHAPIRLFVKHLFPFFFIIIPPRYDTAIGWTISAFGLIQLPLWAFVAIVKQKGDSWTEKAAAAFRPADKWGPSDPITFDKYQKYISQWKSDMDNQPSTSIWGRIKRKLFD